MKNTSFQSNVTITDAFNLYKKSAQSTQDDLQFWKVFLESGIENIKENNINPKLFYSSSFAVYDHNVESQSGYLKLYQQPIIINKNNITERLGNYRDWVLNFSLVRIYNALEIFIFQAIQIRYYPNLKNPLGDKGVIRNINNEIASYLEGKRIKFNTTNNRHIIEYINQTSAPYEIFLKNFIRIDCSTTWGNFFELFSMLRHIIVHDGMIINKDVENAIKSKAKDIFQKHFTLESDEFGYNNLKPIENQIINFILLVNDFAMNTAKFLFEKEDLSFLNMH